MRSEMRSEMRSALEQAREALKGLLHILIDASTDRNGKRYCYISSRSASQIRVDDSIKNTAEIIASIDAALALAPGEPQ
jgi:hypothetical protein